ncbi:fungal-specific transcription factor domain-containing protein [Ilyonectria robusta]|uniref:fungal-specific transcription factor domain-containing protein n=1 Tax=Ilyonectria robusta TaxID=1079257 RepID=UPI001E8DCB5F|nr:fungal-specific transcription factor domain-containing protein [Ilyonectria robusta]KAH8654753.1 fungal-specific transcription factor domain-containing protein [Ilyonectria robusta]
MSNVQMPQSPLSDDGETRATVTSPTNANAKRRTKSSQACDRCRAKKIKCNGARPCKICLNKSIPCSYETMTRRTRGSAKERARLLQAQLDHAQMLLRSAGVLDQSLPTPTSQLQENTQTCIDVLRGAASLPSAPPVLPRYSHTSHDNSDDCLANDRHPTKQSSYQDEADASSASCLFSSQLSLDTQSAQMNPVLRDRITSDVLPNASPDTRREAFRSVGCATNSSHEQDPLDSLIQYPGGIGSGGYALCHDNGHIPEADEPHGQNEHHGPTSFLSICVNPGVEWIANKIGHSNFASSAKTLMSSIGGRVKLNKRLSKERIEDPDAKTAWRYTRAYFEEFAMSTSYIIIRQSFETQLIRHINNPSASQEDSSKSWQYFENALHVETDLIHGGYGLSAIQALLAMSIFSEGGSCQKLEYMLVGCALRLAQSQALHLCSKTSSISNEEDTKRSWLFWSLYCFEKHLALRSGRPSGINDDDISCEIPSQAPDGNLHKLEWFLYAIRLAKISSSIIQNFSTVRARQQPLRDVAKFVEEHDQELRRWYEDVPELYKQNPSVKTIGLPSGILDEHLHYFRLSYHGYLAVVHCVFGHPWNIPAPIEDQDEAVRERVASSLIALADSSRDIILATRSIKVSSMAPAWLLFCYPLIGMMNMFICILHSPGSEHTSRDLSLLEMVAGYFGYLDYASDGAISFSFTSSLRTWARQVVSSANAHQESLLASNPLPASAQQMEYGGLDFFNEISDFTIDQMALEDWPSFLPHLP